MKKIPVGRTIAHAYRFAFGNFLDVLRAMWAPLAIYMVLTVPLSGRTARMMAEIQAHDPSAPSELGPLLLLYPFLLILFFVQFLAVAETALGVRPNSSWFYFPIGRKLWRLIGGFVVAFLAIIALVLLYALVGFILGFLLNAVLGKTLSPNVAHGIVALLAVVLILVGYGALIFVAVRFLFLLAPANIVEQQLGVGRSWVLTRGNFWRAFLISLSIFIPLVVIEYAAIFAAIGLPPMSRGMSTQALESARMAWNLAMLSAFGRYWYIALPLFSVVLVVYFGAGCAAQAFAYRTLTEDEASAPVAGD